jgi:hypothetical protein
MKLCSVALLLVTMLWGCAWDPARNALAGFYSSEPYPGLGSFGDHTGKPSSKSPGVVFVLILQSDGRYHTNEYQLYDGKAVSDSGWGTAMQTGDQGIWSVTDSQVLLTSDRAGHEKGAATLKKENGTVQLKWYFAKYLKRESDVIEPLLPVEKWTIAFGGECWRIDQRVYPTPSQSIIRYIRCDSTEEATPTEKEESVVDMFLPEGHFTDTMELMQQERDMGTFGRGPQIEGEKVIYHSPSEMLYECWAVGLTARYELKLVKHDPALSAKYHLSDGVFVLTYSIPKSQMTEDVRARWIERLSHAKLR